jgi:hypothetical protein
LELTSPLQLEDTDTGEMSWLSDLFF